MKLELSDREAEAVHTAIFVHERHLIGQVILGIGVSDESVARGRAARAVMERMEAAMPWLKTKREITR